MRAVPSMRPHAWGKSASFAYWQAALRHVATTRQDDTHLCHPLTQLAWAAPLVPAPSELAVQAQVRNTFATGTLRADGPSLLPFPGPGVENSAACVAAMTSVDWMRVRTLAAELDEQTDVAEVALRSSDGSVGARWHVAARSLELVIAHALRDRPVAVRCVAEANPVLLDPTMAHAVLKRANRLDLLGPPNTAAAPGDGWREHHGDGVDSGAVRLLDPAVVMNQRDLEPPCWPKVWHFAEKMRSFGEDEHARWRCFGQVPVRWVPVAGRWTCGSRHRVLAALLNGDGIAAVPASGSARPRGP